MSNEFTTFILLLSFSGDYSQVMLDPRRTFKEEPSGIMDVRFFFIKLAVLPGVKAHENM